jgi:segregation and condensation protein A
MELHKVAVNGFEGPLNLLLDLIELEKMDVSRLSLAHVTNQYLEILRGLEDLRPEAIAEFLAVGSRLILIKSQRLLPQFELTREEEENILSLEEQLRQYQQYREKAKIIRQLWQNQGQLFGRDSYLGVAISFYPPSGFSGADMETAMNRLVATLPVMENTHEEEAVAKVVSLEQRILEIRERIKNAVTTSFRDSLGGAKRADVVVSFLALLELVKQKIVSVEQEDYFQDIFIRKRENDGTSPQ